MNEYYYVYLLFCFIAGMFAGRIAAESEHPVRNLIITIIVVGSLAGVIGKILF